jgi:selenide,water dikinase
VLVGISTSDDAAVFRLGETALVATVDLFTPIVDDPRDFGRIAAANALSDVYAMGGQPLFALSIVGFPAKKLPLDMLSAILRGGAEKAAEAGISIVGGHSIDDAEPKYGLAVIGQVHPDKAVRNSTARAGDVLILTKPIGTGVISQAIKVGRAAPADVALAVETMATLNRAACEAMVEVGAHAATDVTGFGLVGHLHEVVHASGVAARLRASALPILPGAREAAAAGVVPGGSKRNGDFFGRWIAWADSIDAATRILLADAQTSGGLLIAVDPSRETAMIDALGRRGVTGRVIGRLEDGPAGRIVVE